MLDLTATAARLGQYTWYERRLFEVVGAWATGTDPIDPADLDAKLWFADVAEHHAWHASLWHERLPELREVDRGGLLVPAEPAGDAFIEALRATTSTLGRLVGLARVAVPRLVVALEDHREIAAPLADGAVLRTIGIVRADLIDDWAAGERLLQRQLERPGGLDEAADTQRAFESAAGGSVLFG